MISETSEFTIGTVLYQHDRLFQFPAKLANIAFLQFERGHFRIELQHDQVMADIVVKILRETAPFFFVSLTKLSGKVTQPLLGVAVSLPQRLAYKGLMLRVAGEQRELID